MFYGSARAMQQIVSIKPIDASIILLLIFIKAKTNTNQQAEWHKWKEIKLYQIVFLWTWTVLF